MKRAGGAEFTKAMRATHTILLPAVQSGRFQTDRIAFMEPQTGGACRAGNIYNLMIESLKKAGYSQIPVISLNAFGQYRHGGFTITPKLLSGAVAAVCFGDLLMTLYQQVRPYERKKGEAGACWDYRGDLHYIFPCRECTFGTVSGRTGLCVPYGRLYQLCHLYRRQ